MIDLFGLEHQPKHSNDRPEAALEWQQSSILEAIAGLYGGIMTYGQFNVERNRIVPAGNAKMAEAANRNSAARAQQAQQDAAASARELREYQERNNATMQMLIQQTQMNKPIRTDCNRFGNSVNCTTR